jgi:hypothetical protein
MERKEKRREREEKEKRREREEKEKRKRRDRKEKELKNESGIPLHSHSLLSSWFEHSERRDFLILRTCNAEWSTIDR